MFPAPFDLSCPAATPDSTVTVEVVSSGILHADRKLVVNTGESGPIDLSLNMGLIHHPQGLVMVDSGMGQATRDGKWPHFPLSPKGNELAPGSTAKDRGLSPLRVLLTHAHYDHIGGLMDLPGAEVWLWPAEWAYMHGFDLSAGDVLASDLHFKPVLPDGWVMGRPAADVMGDGTVWYLQLPGHTPGAAAVLVRAKDAQYLFIGDTAWVRDHLENARRPWYTAALIDADLGLLNQSLQWARWLHHNCPDLRVITGHDLRDLTGTTPA